MRKTNEVTEMKTYFTEPELNISILNVEDVIATSSGLEEDELPPKGGK